jgi:hypothetical protein
MIISFLFSSPDGDISPSAEDLEKPFLISPSMPHPYLALGDYFNAARSFLLEDHWDGLLNASHDQTGKPCREEEIRKIIIRSEKQGAFYHVASVEIEGREISRKFSLVAAMTEKSRAVLERECETLGFLHNRRPSSTLPRIYFRGDRDIVRGNQKETFSFLLEEWLEGYHEWHVTRDGTGRQYLNIWDQGKGYYTASDKLFFQLFHQAARTLTLLYDPETACQVRPWHHAAGDFVIGNLKDEPSIRLTTARGYEPLLTLPGKSPEKTLANLLFFFLDMGVRMRLDRLDGVSEVTWIEGNILAAVMEGFFAALNTMIHEGYFRETIARDFLDLLKSFSPPELISAFEPLIETYQQGGQEELTIIMENLPGHVEELCSLKENFALSNPPSGS